MRIEKFQDFLEKDLAWRKMEISQLFMILNSAEAKDIVGKAMILLLYAHWEGFIKKSSKYYLQYVSEKRVALNALTRNFEAIMLKKYARECIDKDSKNLAKEFAFMDAQYKRSNKPFHVDIDVNNEFEVLYEFMEKLPGALKPGGRVAILTFHSGEDKLVKKALKAGYKEGIYSEYARDVVRPSAQECAQNGRARSTKMRWAVKAE